MKLARAKSSCYGLTLVEVLALLFAIFVVALMIFPHEPVAHKNVAIVQCLNNQKQIALGFIMWQGDNTNQFPWQVSNTNGGTMEDAERGYAAANFHALDAYIKSPYIFVCPTDKARTMPVSVAAIHNNNLSYFVGLDTNNPPSACILTGDRNLQAGQSPVLPGLFIRTNGRAMGWTGELHSENSNERRGVMSFYDGHGELVVDSRMGSVFQQTGLETNRFDIP